MKHTVADVESSLRFSILRLLKWTGLPTTRRATINLGKGTTCRMSKEKRAADARRTELLKKVQQLEVRLATAVNALAREKYTKELAEARRALMLLN